MTQNTKIKTSDESPVYVDEVDLFHPEEDETARQLREELKAERDQRLRLAPSLLTVMGMTSSFFIFCRWR